MPKAATFTYFLQVVIIRATKSQ